MQILLIRILFGCPSQKDKEKVYFKLNVGKLISENLFKISQKGE